LAQTLRFKEGRRWLFYLSDSSAIRSTTEIKQRKYLQARRQIKMRKNTCGAAVQKEREITRRLKIGEVADLSGIGIETLRFYEKAGVLDAPARAASGYRMYSPNVLERLKFIKQAQSLGLMLDEIRSIIKDVRAGKSPCAKVREIVRQRLSEVERHIAEMVNYREAIAETLKNWDKISEPAGRICGLIESSALAPPLKPKEKLKMAGLMTLADAYAGTMKETKKSSLEKPSRTGHQRQHL
jgi:MerR family transcriptional regulator, copper efflux regulator